MLPAECSIRVKTRGNVENYRVSMRVPFNGGDTATVDGLAGPRWSCGTYVCAEHGPAMTMEPVLRSMLLGDSPAKVEGAPACNSQIESKVPCGIAGAAPGRL